jgi:hypothetical protein
MAGVCGVRATSRKSDPESVSLFINVNYLVDLLGTKAENPR